MRTYNRRPAGSECRQPRLGRDDSAGGRIDRSAARKAAARESGCSCLAADTASASAAGKVTWQAAASLRAKAA